MSKKGFRQPRKRDEKAIDNFAEGADVSTNTENVGQEEKEEKQTQEPFYTTLQPRYKKIIQAVAYYDRISQREVVEQALSGHFNEEHLDQAIEAYENQQGDG